MKRAYVSDRNSTVNYAVPSDPSNSIQSNVWNIAVSAAIMGSDSSQLDSNIPLSCEDFGSLTKI